MDLPVVTSVEPLEGYRLRLTFADGTNGEVDLSEELWGEVFEPLKDPALFRQVRVDEGMGTVAWPNGADIAPETLYAQVRGDRLTA